MNHLSASSLPAKTSLHHERLVAIHQVLVDQCQALERTADIFLVADSLVKCDLVSLEVLDIAEVGGVVPWQDILHDELFRPGGPYPEVKAAYAFAFHGAGRALLEQVRAQTQAHGWYIVHATAEGYTVLPGTGEGPAAAGASIRINATPSADPHGSGPADLGQDDAGRPGGEACGVLQGTQAVAARSVPESFAPGPEAGHQQDWSRFVQRLAVLDSARTVYAEAMASGHPVGLSDGHAAAAAEALNDFEVLLQCVTWDDAAAIRLWLDLAHRAPRPVRPAADLLLACALHLQGDHLGYCAALDRARAALTPENEVLASERSQAPEQLSAQDADGGENERPATPLTQEERYLRLQHLRFMHLVLRFIGEGLSRPQIAGIAEAIMAQSVRQAVLAPTDPADHS